MAWDFVLGCKTGRDWSVGRGMEIVGVEVLTPMQIAKLIRVVDTEISSNAKMLIKAMQQKRVTEDARKQFSALFKRWEAFKKTLNKQALTEGKTGEVAMLFRVQNGMWTKVLTGSTTMGAAPMKRSQGGQLTIIEATIVPVKKSKWPMAIGLGVGAGILGWFAFGRKG